MISNSFSAALVNNTLRKELVHHPFFQLIRSGNLNRANVAIFVGQWWHPLHYFPTFLARTIAVVPTLEMKTAISAILFQELGEGDPARAHERIYIETMTGAGFTRDETMGSSPLPATRRLVKRYESATSDSISALGFVYGTEVADLAMVSGIGKAVRQVSGKKSLPWVDIHVRQEPQHVEKASESVRDALSSNEQVRIIKHAEEMWELWIAFFSELEERVELAPVFDRAPAAVSTFATTE